MGRQGAPGWMVAAFVGTVAALVAAGSWAAPPSVPGDDGWFAAPSPTTADGGWFAHPTTSAPGTTTASTTLPLITTAPTSSAAPASTLPLITTAPTTLAPVVIIERPISPAPPTSAAPAPNTLRMAFTGDFLWHSPLWAQAERNASASGQPAGARDFRPMLAELVPYTSTADLAVCHLETPIAPAGEAYSTHPDGYGAPPETAEAIAAAGFDRCSTASNHTVDRGIAGIDRTIDVLAANGVAQSGMAHVPADIAPQVFVANGIVVSHLSYTFSYNGLRLPADQEWRSALIDEQRILADAATARALGAELVIVSLHWGVEGSHAVGSDQRRLAESLTASGNVDLIVGHHAHVLQPIEQINGVWVLFGLGNIISNLPTSERWPAASQDAALAMISVERAADGTIIVGRPWLVPTWVDRNNGWVVRAIPDRLADPTTPEGLRGQLERSLARTTAVVGEYLLP